MGLLKKLTSAFVAGSLVLSLVGTASAAFDSTSAIAAAQHMKELGIIQGRPDGDLGLNDTITRAELATILVRAFGQDANAALLKGAPSFPDVSASHWASGYVFIASNIATKSGNPLGYPDGSFQPDGKVTQAEAIAFSMKFLGVSPVAALAWPLNYLQGAVNASLLSEADMNALVASAGAEAKRNLVFYIVDNGFQTYKLPSGKTVYQTYVDSIGPVVTVENINDGNTTSAASVTVKGTVKDGTTSISDMVTLTVGGKAVTADANGNWSTTVAVDQLGANTVTASATDLAGNMGTASLTVTRVAGAAATIEASASATTLTVGSTADLTVKVMDESGMETADTPTYSASGAVTVDADGKVTAAKTPGTGTVTVAAGDVTTTVSFTVNPGPLAKISADKTSVAAGGKITLTPTDAEGNAITSGVTYSVDSADAIVSPSGIFIGSTSGTYVVTAKSGDATATITVGIFGDATALKLEAPASMVANGATEYTVKASLTDEFGNVVNQDDVVVTLSGVGIASSDLTVETVDGVAEFTVTLDEALAGQDTELSATYTDGDSNEVEATATVSGVTQVATKLSVVSAAKYIAANAGTTTAVTVEVLDQEGEAVVGGEYAITAAITGPAKVYKTGDTSTKTDTYTGAAVSFTVDNTSNVGSTGSLSLTFTAEGLESATATISQVVAGNPAKLAVKSTKVDGDAATTATADDVYDVTVELQDANGVPVPTDSDLTLDLTFGSDKVAQVGGATTVALTNTNTTAAFQVHATGKFTGDVKVDVADHAGNLTATATTLNFTPGAYAKIAVDRADTIVPFTDAKVTVTASLTDVLGNAVAKSDVVLTGTLTLGGVANTELTINGETDGVVLAKTDATGKATFNLALSTAPTDNRTYVLTVEGRNADDVAMTDQTSNVTTKASVVASMTGKLYKKVTVDGVDSFIAASNVDADSQFFYVLTVKDQYGAGVNSVAGDLALDVDEIMGDGVSALIDTGSFLASSDNLNLSQGGQDLATALGITATSGKYIGEFTAGKAGLQTIKASYDLVKTAVSASNSIVFNVGSLYTVSVNGDEDIELDAGTIAGPISLKLTDKYGNAVNAAATKDITVTPSSATVNVRLSTGGITVSKVSTKNSASFYVVGTTAGGYTLTFDNVDLNAPVVVTVTVN